MIAGDLYTLKTACYVTKSCKKKSSISGLLQLTSIFINVDFSFSTMLSAIGTEILCIFVRLNMSDVNLYPSSFNVKS